MFPQSLDILFENLPIPNHQTLKHIQLSGSESCVRLVDVDQDGALDIIMGLTSENDVTQNVRTEADRKNVCAEQGIYCFVYIIYNYTVCKNPQVMQV